MRKLLIIEAMGTAGEYLLNSAKDQGLYTVVATHEDVYDTYPAHIKDLIDHKLIVDFSDTDKALQQLARAAADLEISGVVACWEFLSPLATKVAADLGLPGNDVSVADASRNKRLMAELFDALDVPAPRTLVAMNGDGVAQYVRASGLRYPVVVKPAENSASFGVSVVDREADLLPAISLASSWPVEFPHGTKLENTVLIQEYLDGKEYSVETAIVAGEMHHLAITEKFTTEDSSRAETGHTVPARVTPATSAAIIESVERALKSLGFHNGIAHAELKVTTGGEAKIIEVGARPPGDHIMRLVELATGVSEAAAYIKIALGEIPELEPTKEDAAAIRFLTPSYGGTFERVDGIVDSEALVESSMYRTRGDKVEDPTNNLARVGQLLFVGPDSNEVNQAAEVALANVAVVVGR